jgi:pimeloyl-ACP methyl ester carboxylesterase
MNRMGPSVLADVAQRRVVDLPGRRRTVVWEAAGPPGAPALVLLHGATLNAELNWSGVIGPLARYYRVVAFDQRGHGEGLRASPFRLEDCADDVAALAHELGIDRVVPVGYSMGGFVAQLLWRRHRDLVAGLVLCSTARNVCGSPWERTVAMMLPTVVAAATWSLALYPLGADTLGAGLLDHDLDPARRAWALAQMRRTTLLDALATAQAGCEFTSHDWVGSIDVPTASVITVRDRIVPPRRQYKLARALPDNTVIEVDADHGGFLASPGRFAAAVLAACDVVCGEADRLDEEPVVTAS